MRSHFYEKSPYRTREGGSAIDGFMIYMLMRYRTGVRFEKKIELVFDYFKRYNLLLYHILGNLSSFYNKCNAF